MDKVELPENIRQALELIAAVFRRIQNKKLDIKQTPCLYMSQSEGVALA